MSWSVNLIGTPTKITAALKKQSETLTGQSKEEFDAALPHMLGLLAQNYAGTYEPAMRITASGHGYTGYNTCLVNIENLGVAAA